MQIFPIGGSNVAWKELLKVVRDNTGKNIALAIDDSPIKYSAYYQFILALKEFKNEDNADELSPALSHLFLSCIIIDSPSVILELMELTGLKALTLKSNKERVAYISGTILEWLYTIKVCAKHEKLKPIGIELVQIFSKLGLKPILQTCIHARIK